VRHAAQAAQLCTLLACARGEPLAGDRIEAAERRWQAAGLGDYRLALSIEGDRVQAGDFQIEVRGGTVTSASRNGTAVASRDLFYTVPGLFTFLRDEQGMAAAPERYFGVPAGTPVTQRARFHAELGYPERYLRAVRGTQHGIEIIVHRVERLE
jgi:hypothetical protein